MHREQIDAEAARFIISRHLGHQDPQFGTQRDTALWWAIQTRIARGGLDGARNITDEKAHARSARLAELHTETLTHPENASAMAERDKLLTDIAHEAHREIEQMDREIEAGTRVDYFHVNAPGPNR